MINKKKVITLADLDKRISTLTSINIEDVKLVLGCIIPEMKYEVLQGNKFTFPGVMAVYKEPIKRNGYTDVRTGERKANVNVFSLKVYRSPMMIKSLNFGFKKD